MKSYFSAMIFTFCFFSGALFSEAFASNWFICDHCAGIVYLNPSEGTYSHFPLNNFRGNGPCPIATNPGLCGPDPDLDPDGGSNDSPPGQDPAEIDPDPRDEYSGHPTVIGPGGWHMWDEDIALSIEDPGIIRCLESFRRAGYLEPECKEQLADFLDSNGLN